MLDKNTKTVLAVAAVAGVGYYLWMQNKKAAPKAFANFMSADDSFSDATKPIAECKGDYGKDANGDFICCRAGYRAPKSKGIPCGSVGQLSSEDSVENL